MSRSLQGHKLESMFMKHYAPNRCLYIKVAKLRTGVGSTEMLHLQNCSLKIYLKRTLGGGGGSGWGGQDGCERRIKLFVKIQKKIFFFFIFFGGGGGGGGGSGRGREGGRVGEGGERRIEVFVKIQKKNGGGGGQQGEGGGVRLGGQGGCDRRIEFFGKLHKK